MARDEKPRAPSPGFRSVRAQLEEDLPAADAWDAPVNRTQRYASLALPEPEREEPDDPWGGSNRTLILGQDEPEGWTMAPPKGAPTAEPAARAQARPQGSLSERLAEWSLAPPAGVDTEAA